MFKKATLAIVAVLIVGGLLFGSKLVPLGKSVISKAQAMANDAIGIEGQIDIAKEELKAIGPAIKKMVHQIAKEKAEIIQLENKLARNDANLKTAYEEMAELRRHLESGDEVYVSATNKAHSTAAVRRDLESRFANYKMAKSTRDTLAEVINTRQEALTEGIRSLEDAQLQEQAMKVEIENLIARKKRLDAQAQIHNLELDSSAITRTRKALEDVSSRISTSEIEREMLPKTTGRIDVSTNGNIDMKQDILDEMDAFFKPTVDSNELVNN